MKKVKAKHKTDPTQILLGKFSLDFLNRRNNKEHEKWNNKKKKSKNYNRKAITFTVHCNKIKLKYTDWFNIHLEK